MIRLLADRVHVAGSALAGSADRMRLAGRAMAGSARLALLALLVASTASTGCVILNPDGNAVVEVTPPAGGPTAFKPVALFLGRRCGTLECHGEVGRNFLLYGQYGLRLSTMDQPGGGLTTAAEVDADFQSAVALEPEIMSLVVEQHGADPTRLTLVRKPCGIEAHKGGMLITVGDEQYTCLTSWLTGTVNTSACQSAVQMSW